MRVVSGTWRGEGDEWNVDGEWDKSGECYVEG